MLEGKEVDVGNFSDPQEAKDAIRHAIRLYDEHFAQAATLPARKQSERAASLNTFATGTNVGQGCQSRG